MVRVMSGKNVWILTEYGRVVNLLFKIIFERTFHNSGLLFQMLQLICSDLNNNVCTNKIVFFFNLTLSLFYPDCCIILSLLFSSYIHR